MRQGRRMAMGAVAGHCARSDRGGVRKRQQLIVTTARRRPPRPPPGRRCRHHRRERRSRRRRRRRATTTAAGGAGRASPAPSTSPGQRDAADDGKGKSIGLLFDVTGRGDKSFNDAAAAGLDKAKTDFGITGQESTPDRG